MAGDIATGTTVVFGTSGFTGEITAVNGNGISRGSVQTSHMGTTGGHTFKPTDLYDPGTLDLELWFDPSSQPPYTGAAETVTVTFPSGNTVSGSAFVTDFTYGAPLEDMMTASVTLKWSGALTWG